jgi:hypothetical protein
MNLVKVKTNWKQAFSWTAFVALVTCMIFTSLLVASFFYFGVGKNLRRNESQIIQELEQKIYAQTKNIDDLKLQNEKIHQYLQLWTPIPCDKNLNSGEKWRIKGYGLPEIQSRSYLPMRGEEGDKICSPFLGLSP